MIPNERTVVNPVNNFIVRTSVWQMPLFLSVLAERNKRSITSSNLVSARQNFAARNCCVGAARRVFMILSHPFQFLLQLIEQKIIWKQRWLPDFQIWKNFARESDVTSVLYSIPGNMGVYEQTRVHLLHLPKTYCWKMNVTLVWSTFIISLHFIAVEFIHLYSIIAIFSKYRFFITTEQFSI